LHHPQQIFDTISDITKSRLLSGFFAHAYHAQVAAFETGRLPCTIQNKSLMLIPILAKHRNSTLYIKAGHSAGFEHIGLSNEQKSVPFQMKSEIVIAFLWEFYFIRSKDLSFRFRLTVGAI